MRKALLSSVVLLLARGAGAQPAIDAKQIYDSRCAFCHGAAGRGDGPAGAALKPPPTNFASNDYWKQTDDTRVRTAIARGKPGTGMVPFGASLGAKEIDALIPYLRAFAR